MAAEVGRVCVSMEFVDDFDLLVDIENILRSIVLWNFHVDIALNDEAAAML